MKDDSDPSLVSDTVQRVNGIRWRTWLLSSLITLVVAALLGMSATFLWLIIRSGQGLEAMALGVMTFLIFAKLNWIKRGPSIDNDAFLFDLEIKNPDTETPAWKAAALGTRPDEAVPAEEWRKILTDRIDSVRRSESKKTLRLASTIPLPLLVAGLIAWKTPGELGHVFASAIKPVIGIAGEATLTVLEGANQKGGEAGTQTLRLSTDKPASISLISRNLLELTVEDVHSDDLQRFPVAVLKGTGEYLDRSPPEQTFQLSPVDQPSKGGALTEYSVTFSVAESSELYVNTLSLKTPAARFDVEVQPVPLVSLKQTEPPQEPWPDDRPLKLAIHTKSKRPLGRVNLLILAGGQEHRETVRNVLTQDRYELKVDYTVLLETYLQRDLEEIEIIAEVIDQSIPTPLIGHSRPLKLFVASAYGRYQRTLQTLREIKTLVDEAKSERSATPSAEILELADKAWKQAANSPFFDALDRFDMKNIRQKIHDNQVSPKLENVYAISTALNNFLFEHEILDDRERDRDFFVAARGLSRLMEMLKQDRPLPVKVAATRLIDFVKTRQERWKIRVNRLSSQDRPAQWSRIRDSKPFESGLKRVADLVEKSVADTPPDAITTLSQVTQDYRSWINDLEAAEDKARETMEQERQQGLASARNQLRELQKMQGKISTSLDRADSRDQERIQDDWPPVRMKQKTNAKQTKKLEAQIRSLSPEASDRIRAAGQAMRAVVKEGDQSRFVRAESNSDLAGRLLRQADSAARQSQGGKGRRNRRRRVSGDNYYGQSVVGGDVAIKREYQVDRRYREDILDEVHEAEVNQEERAYLENYLRRIVR